MSTSPNRRLLALIGRLYGVLLIAFPKEFRARLGTDARQAFQDGCRAALKRRGALGLAAYALRGALDVAKEAPMERIAAWRQGRRERQRKRERQRTQPRREVSSLNGRGMGMDGLIQDIRFAVRAFSRRPAFTAVALLTLMLGIGASTSIFSVLNGVLLRPFPYPDADRLVVFWNTNPERGRDQFRMSAPDFLEFERSATSFTGMTLATGATSNLTGDNLPPLRVEGAMVSANLLREPRRSRLLSMDCSDSPESASFNQRVEWMTPRPNLWPLANASSHTTAWLEFFFTFSSSASRALRFGAEWRDT